MKTEYYSIGKAAEFLGISVLTLRKYHKDGIIIPDIITPGGTRKYSRNQLEKYLGINQTRRRVVAYARVSSKKQEQDLQKQIDNLELYMLSKGYQFDLITDIGSGINYSKKGFLELLRLVEEDKISKIVILYKDRLLRFGFELFEEVCKLHNTEIEIISSAGETPEEELVNDLIQVVKVFSCKLQGKRSQKTKDLIKELKNGDN